MASSHTAKEKAPSAERILATLVRLLAEQEGVKVDFTIKERTLKANESA